ncbi:hypothetical protein VNI00_009087 [Paramarasmius palmivorus]|uniref:Protein artemis n=1 Tax=Paramarasmius palmivorus TaxID=297713 RepID=A0AAW0CS62_9AGAR
MPPGAPFRSFALPYPIRIDEFTSLPSSDDLDDPIPKPKLHLLTHTHSDHVVGLAAKGFGYNVICSEDAKEMLLRIEEGRERALLQNGCRAEPVRKYRHLKVDEIHGPDGEVINGHQARDLLSTCKVNDPFTKEYGEGAEVVITAIGANHCPGSVMYLIEGSQGNILHTGDFRAEPWFLDSVKQNPFLQPYLALSQEETLTHGTGVVKTLDAIYLDTACVMQTHEVPTKESATSGLIALMKLYPPTTLFFVNTWTIGYEDILKSIARAFGCKIHFDRYKYKTVTHLRHEPLLKALGTMDPESTRFHACERFDRCHVVNVEGDEHSGGNRTRDNRRVVYVNPVSSMTPEIWENYQATMKERLLSVALDEREEEIGCLLVPLSRHSPLPELRSFVSLFKPKRIIPNTLEPKLQGLDWVAIERAFEGCLSPSTDSRIPPAPTLDLDLLKRLFRTLQADLKWDQEEEDDTAMKNLVDSASNQGHGSRAAKKLASDWVVRVGSSSKDARRQQQQKRNKGKLGRRLNVIMEWLEIDEDSLLGGAYSTSPLLDAARTGRTVREKSKLRIQPTLVFREQEPPSSNANATSSSSKPLRSERDRPRVVVNSSSDIEHDGDDSSDGEDDDHGKTARKLFASQSSQSLTEDWERSSVSFDMDFELEPEHETTEQGAQPALKMVRGDPVKGVRGAEGRDVQDGGLMTPRTSPVADVGTRPNIPEYQPTPPVSDLSRHRDNWKGKSTMPDVRGTQMNLRLSSLESALPPSTKDSRREIHTVVVYKTVKKEEEEVLLSRPRQPSIQYFKPLPRQELSVTRISPVTDSHTPTPAPRIMQQAAVHAVQPSVSSLTAIPPANGRGEKRKRSRTPSSSHIPNRESLKRPRATQLPVSSANEGATGKNSGKIIDDNTRSSQVCSPDANRPAKFGDASSQREFYDGYYEFIKGISQRHNTSSQTSDTSMEKGKLSDTTHNRSSPSTPVKTASEFLSKSFFTDRTTVISPLRQNATCPDLSPSRRARPNRNIPGPYQTLLYRTPDQKPPLSPMSSKKRTEGKMDRVDQLARARPGIVQPSFSEKRIKLDERYERETLRVETSQRYEEGKREVKKRKLHEYEEGLDAVNKGKHRSGLEPAEAAINVERRDHWAARVKEDMRLGRRITLPSVGKSYETSASETDFTIQGQFFVTLVSVKSNLLKYKLPLSGPSTRMSKQEKDFEYGDTSVSSSDVPQVLERPRGVKGLYYHPLTQITMLGFVCFMCPGLFNAINGLGAAGRVDPTTSSNSNTALYSTFGVAAFFSGSINNVLGSKLTLLLGSFGYCIYIGSYLALNLHPEADGFVIAAGAILGVCAGMLWSAQGSLMLSYPTEAQKGKYIAVFWSIFNMGSVVGAAVSLGQNFHSTANGVNTGTYVGFLILTAIGISIPTLMVNPKNIIRTDGTQVNIPLHPSWRTQIWGLWVALRTDPLIILLFPMFFCSNWFYTWQFNMYNGAIFNIRARSLNNLVYWTSQIIGSISISILLDRTTLSRRVRAFSSWAILFVMIFVTHVWALFYQKAYTRETYRSETARIDIYDPRYIPRVWLYILFGILDAMWQTTAYWIMGAMSNDPAKLAYFAGFYKSLQSAGAAVVWRADAVGLSYMGIFLSTWVLLVAGLLFALPMIHLRVKDHTDMEDEVIARMDSSGRVRDIDEVSTHR